MRLPSRARFGLTLLCLPLLAGCFNYSEEIAFDENGAGTLAYVFERGQQGAFAKLAAEFTFDNPVEDTEKLKDKLPPGVTLEKFNKIDDEKSKQTRYEATFKFDNLDKFNQWKEHSEIVQVFGGISLRKVNEEWLFERKFSASEKALDGAKQRTKNSKVVLKLTGPGKLIEHNGARVENERTVVWEGEFASLLEGADGTGSVLKARYSVAKPNLVAIAGIACVIFVVLGVVIVMLRKKDTTKVGEA
ncbi:MAG: hypothetical protein M5U26_08635 [Planctomycetota bacterium]|nr:hypothetical protein [Planctomycetota bacterium]